MYSFTNKQVIVWEKKNIASNYNICKSQTVSTLCALCLAFIYLFSIHFLSTGLQWGASNLWLGCQRKSTMWDEEDSIMFQTTLHEMWLTDNEIILCVRSHRCLSKVCVLSNLKWMSYSTRFYLLSRHVLNYY